MATTIEDDKEDDLRETLEISVDGGDEDIIGDMIVVDDDYREEVRLALEQQHGVTGATTEPTEEDEDQMKRDYVTLDFEEKNLFDFAKNQLRRMQMIRDLLLGTAPDRDLLDGVPADKILNLPLIKRWMLFSQWKNMYQDVVNQDLLDTQAKYESKIKEYNQLKGEALASLCRTADVVGMTTTGAAKNRSMLESLKAKIGKFSFKFGMKKKVCVNLINKLIL